MRFSFSALKTKPSVHFLHIGKNAGTAITHMLSEINSDPSVALHFERHAHDVVLSDLDANAAYFFSIRNPIERFLSGFYSRKRKGQPRIYNEWDIYEEKAFHAFPDANDLAESLFQEGKLGQLAIEAMTGIKHVNTMQYHWLGPLQWVFEQRPPVMILRQNFLHDDLALLLNRLEVKKTFILPKEPVKTHENNYSGVPGLTEKAQANLKKWYAPDIWFYEQASLWAQKQHQEV
ncbi:MAG: sulfotransferase family 2 domain-containing protein [Hydrogenovibrio sp.]|uniref:sulfotransferase family 2 domain-containing protein n=1 Tax=Hydrogenovibrio sp. TaxID=2065821 RepID=UPI00286FB047|nr:sulfotransferase family 2 domain-containing protein [Hydrogenovibrio sp.]MDR9498547.1 sulfotransferase family 2 domain-containing protein [Hydrogenovibrio sp.]MDR9499223.1 sulfotransferase family 2 domain-containing protein [Hydrogenovibrio sp.]